MNEIIYLDKEFIINEYEKTHKKVPVKYTKTTIVQAGVNFGASMGGSLRESFEYDIRINDMWIKSKSNLEKNHNSILLSDLSEKKNENIFWIDGLFGISKVTTASGGIVTDSYITYKVGQEECGCGNELDIILDSSYFTSGYSQLLGSSNSSVNGFKIKAKMLLKILGTVDKNKYILTPLVIEKTGYHFIEEK